MLRRLGQALPTVAGLLLVTFLLVHLAPGDPMIALGGEHGDAGYYAMIRAKFGLDRPLRRAVLSCTRGTSSPGISARRSSTGVL